MTVNHPSFEFVGSNPTGVTKIRSGNLSYIANMEFAQKHLNDYSLIFNLSYGVIGNTSRFGREESRFEPLWDNTLRGGEVGISVGS